MKLQFTKIQAVLLAVWGMAMTAQAQSAAFGAAQTYNFTLHILTNGTCQIKAETIMSRKQKEAQIRMMERSSQPTEATEEDDEESVTPRPPKPAEKPKPMTDDELRKKLEEENAAQDEYGQLIKEETKLETLEISSNTVRIVQTVAYGSLKEAVIRGASLISRFGFQTLKVDTDDKGKLRLTLDTPREKGGNSKIMMKFLKMSGIKGELRFVLPGAVLASGLPNTKDQATWVSMDSQVKDSYEALAKLLEAPVVITAEPGGLVVKEPLDSEKLQRDLWSRRSSEEPDLPVTDAGPGFKVEAKSVKTTTVYDFPDAKKYAKATRQLGHETARLEMEAVLFAPKGRTIQAISDVRIITARDDQGRTVKAPAESSGRSLFSAGSFPMGHEAERISAPFQLTLELPPPDTQALEEVQFEAVVTTSGPHKELTLPATNAVPPTAVDLASILPGATLKIIKVTQQKMQHSVTLVVHGPTATAQLDFQATLPGARNVSTSSNTVKTTTKEGRTERTITLTAYSYGDSNDTTAQVLTLLIRLPAELRKERVKLTLKELDFL